MTQLPEHTTSPLFVAPVTAQNWRAVAALTVRPDQAEYVNAPVFNLALCHYSPVGWAPLAVLTGDGVVGFLMWAVDPADGFCWLGGVMIDQGVQGRGYGKAAMRAALAYLHHEHGHTHFALSYHPTNAVAAHLYRGLGFQETGEQEDDEVVARFVLSPLR